MRFPIFSDLPRRTAPVHLALTVAGGGFTDLVIDTIFGADLRLVGALNAEPKLEGFDANARLVNLRHQGKKYMISRNGAAVIR